MMRDKSMSSGIRRASIVGAGGLAHSLALRLQAVGVQVVQVTSRGGSRAQALAAQLGGGQTPPPQSGDAQTPLHPDADVVLLAVPDAMIAQVAARRASQLSPQAVLAHCAGSVPLSALSAHAGPVGVLYPLQSFTVGRAVDWATLPLFVEGAQGGQAPLLALAQRLAGADGIPPRILDSATRAQLHLGAVFCSNFVNALVAQAQQLLQALPPPPADADAPALDYRVYLPLLHEVLAKLHTLSPQQAQTGPALRGDAPTLAQHRHLLTAHAPQLLPLYDTLTETISRTGPPADKHEDGAHRE